MNSFPIIPASEKSLLMRRPVYGVGINDSDYLIQPTVNGKMFYCPFYRKWSSMLSRCYSEKYQDRWPTYIGCTVSKDWLVFSNFREWMIQQDWNNKDLDKDILVPGNKVYGPDFCVFIDQSVNKLLNDHAVQRGVYPLGVYFYKRDNRFFAQISIAGKRKNLGTFDTVQQAETAYLQAKNKDIIRVAHLQKDDRVKTALLSLSKNGIVN